MHKHRIGFDLDIHSQTQIYFYKGCKASAETKESSPNKTRISNLKCKKEQAVAYFRALDVVVQESLPKLHMTDTTSCGGHCARGTP